MRVTARTAAGAVGLVIAAALLGAGNSVVWYPDHWRLRAIGHRLLGPWLTPAYLGDGGPAIDLLLCYPMGLAVTPTGDLLVSDRGRDWRGRVVWRIGPEGTAHLVAGTGQPGEAAATTAGAMSFARPEGLAVAGDGTIYVSDGFNHAVFRIETTGLVRRVAGTGVAGFSGDGGPGSRARLFRPADIRLDRKGNLYIADVRNHRVRKLDAAGVITTVAGRGEAGFSPDGTPARDAQLNTPWGLAVDREDRLLIADSGNDRVRRIEEDGTLVTIAGSGVQEFSGDGGPATAAGFNYPEGLFEDERGWLFIADEWNHAVRVVDRAGILSTVIGTGRPGKAHIGAQARGAALDDPENVLVSPSGELIITDGNNGRVLGIGQDGVVRLIAGRSSVRRCSSLW